MILLDTHTWIWWETESERLPPSFVPLILRAAAQGELAISAISCWELAMLIEKGRISLSVDAGEFLRISQEDSNLRVVDIDARIAIQSQLLPGELHRDPADRMIVATAREADGLLLTVDEKLLA